ncbi:DinB family protein [Puia sp.]|jgi:uncharacterized damage-inducible protein DinB|uniref:DinB family protein n=1 Tax=Puia sp. TaxID=2045100 RepID=UPI002F42CE3F
MSTISPLLKEMDQEAQTTRKMLQRVPTAYFSWRPHQKSMTIKQLATHIAELPSWVTMAVTTDELDFAANPYKPEDVSNTEDLLGYFERSLADGRAHLTAAKEETLAEPWTLRNGSDILYVATKGEVIRMAYCQIVHHRAQLGVFLRLLDIPIPGSYGPSADEHEFQPAEESVVEQQL